MSLFTESEHFPGKSGRKGETLACSFRIPATAKIFFDPINRNFHVAPLPEGERDKSTLTMSLSLFLKFDSRVKLEASRLLRDSPGT